jgi:hypothetical protein
MKKSGIVVAALLLEAAVAWAQTSPPSPKSPPKTGDFKDEYKDPKTNALIMRYRMRAPATLPEQKHLGLIVCFHGMNGNEDSVTGFAIEAAKRTGLADQYVLMGGKAKGPGWATNDDTNLLLWIAWAKETYPIDPRRVHIIGMSNGGWMVKRFGWEHQDLFASITPYCGGGVDFSGNPKNEKPAPKAGPGSPAETRTEWYFVHGDADEQVGVDASRRAIKQLGEKGYRYVYREIAGANHGGIMSYPDVADDALRFMHALRHKEMPLAKEDKTELSSFVGKIKTEKGESTVPIIAEASRIGGAPGGRVIDGGMESADAEVRKTSVATVEKTLYGRETVIELIKVYTKDKSEEVKGEAVKALAVAANYRYLEAQETLVSAARRRTAPAADRVAAIQSLGKAAKLQFLGNFEDKHVIWTLVLLLDDDEQKVREAAFAQVEKNVKDTFEYKPDLDTAQRKGPMAKWKAWCTQKCGALEGPSAAK